jgi:hypothetical protein
MGPEPIIRTVQSVTMLCLQDRPRLGAL